jgi:hypothetical protein
VLAALAPVANAAYATRCDRCARSTAARAYVFDATVCKPSSKRYVPSLQKDLGL